MRMKFIVINIMLKHAESKQLPISKQHHIKYIDKRDFGEYFYEYKIKLFTESQT